MFIFLYFGIFFVYFGGDAYWGERESFFVFCLDFEVVYLIRIGSTR